MTLHELIKQERKKKGLSVYKLAKMTGLTESPIFQIEKGNTLGQTKTIQAIIKALDINILMVKAGKKPLTDIIDL